MTTLAIRPKRHVADSVSVGGTIGFSSALITEKIGQVPPGTIGKSVSGGITPQGTLAGLASGPSNVTVPQAVDGSITPAGDAANVALPTTIDVSTVEVGGRIDPKGTIARSASGPNIVTVPNTASGGIAPNGQLAAAIVATGGVATKSIAGTITPAAALASAVSGPSFVTVPKVVASTITPAGAVSTSVVAPVIATKGVVGVITPAGTLATQVGGTSIVTILKSIGGQIVPSGQPNNVKSGPNLVTVPISMGGSIGLSSSVARQVSGPSQQIFPKSVAGTITPVGTRSASVISTPVGLRTMFGGGDLAESLWGDDPVPDNFYGNTNGASFVSAGGDLDTAIANDARLIVKITGNNDNVKNPDESFSTTLWINRFDSWVAGVRSVSGGELKLRNAVTTGNFGGIWGWDDVTFGIEDGAPSGGNAFLRALTFEEFETCSGHVAGVWPWMPVVSRSPNQFLRDQAQKSGAGVRINGIRQYQYLWAGWGQYRPRLDGPPAAYATAEITAGQQCGLGWMSGLNLLDQGAGTTSGWGCIHGHDADLCSCSPAEIIAAWTAFLARPETYGFNSWAYSFGIAYWNRPEIQDALQQGQNVAKNRPEGPLWIKGTPAGTYYTGTEVSNPPAVPPVIPIGGMARDGLTNHKVFHILDNGRVQSAEYTPLSADNARIYFIQNGAGKINDLTWNIPTGSVQFSNGRDVFGTGPAGDIESCIWDRATAQFLYFAQLAAPARIQRRDVGVNTTTLMKDFALDSSFSSFWTPKGQTVANMKITGLHGSRAQDVLCGRLDGSSVGVGAVAWGRLTSFVWNYVAPSGKVVSRVNVDDQGTEMKVNFADGTWQVVHLGGNGQTTLSAVLTDADPPVRDDVRPDEMWQANGEGLKKWNFSTAPAGSTGTSVTGFFASASATNGNGSLANPWSLAQVAAHPAALTPGSTVWLRGGDYTGQFNFRINGTVSQPIHVKQYPGERARIRGTCTFDNGSYTWYWFFEIANIATNTQDLQGVDCHSPGTKFIHIISHDHSGNSFGIWAEAPDSEVYGCIAFNSGWCGSGAGCSTFGHGIYSQNCTGTKRLIDNIVFQIFGYGFHEYTEGSCLLNLTIQGNVAFNCGMKNGNNFLVGGGQPVDELDFGFNMAYQQPGFGSACTWIGRNNTTNQDGNVHDNYLVGGLPCFRFFNWQRLKFQRNTVVGQGTPGSLMDQQGPTAGWTWDHNNFFGSAGTSEIVWNTTSSYTFAQWASAVGLAGTDIYSSGVPSLNKVFIRPSTYQPKRANVIVYNWQNLSSVPVDFSSFLAIGDGYEVRHVFDLWGTPLLTGIYNGSLVSIPMTAVAPPQPIAGGVNPPTPGPRFGVFIVKGPETSSTSPMTGTLVYAHPKLSSKIDVYSKAAASVMGVDEVVYYSTYYENTITQSWTLDTGSIYRLDWTAEMAANPNKLAPTVLRMGKTQLTKVTTISAAGQWSYTSGVLRVWLPGNVNPNTQQMVAFDWRFGMEEIIMVTTGGGLKGRLCRHFGYRSAGDQDAIRGGGVSYDASRVVFSSNWGGSAVSGVYAAMTSPTA